MPLKFEIKNKKRRIKIFVKIKSVKLFERFFEIKNKDVSNKEI
jgi:hypothetical protein